MPLTNDPEEKALLAGVLANPLDDAPRLIIADWYEEHGYEDWAAFMRWHIAESTTKTSAQLNSEKMPLQYLETFLKYEKPFLSNGLVISGRLVPCVRWSRGFINRIRIAHDVWEHHANDILAKHPIEMVELLTSPNLKTMAKRVEINGEWHWAWERQWAAKRPWLKFTRYPSDFNLRSNHHITTDAPY